MRQEREKSQYKSTCKYMFFPVALIALGAIIVMVGIILSKVGTTTTSDAYTTSILSQMFTKNQETEAMLKESFSILQEQLDQQQSSILSGQGNIVSLMTVSPSSLIHEAEEEERPTLECDVVIVGAGVGGLTLAYRLAPLLQNRLCLIDESTEVGGREKSLRYVYSSTYRPVWTPTHSSGFSSDSSLRCLAQEVGTLSVMSGSVGSHIEYNYMDINVTGFQCSGKSRPNSSVHCRSGGFPPEASLSPNGQRHSSPYGLLPEVCPPALDWTQCSYREKLTEILKSDEKSKSIRNGESLELYCQRILGPEATAYLRDLSDWGGNLWDSDARISVEILRNQRPTKGKEILLPHGGPQVGLLKKMARLIMRNQSRLWLETRVNSVERNPTGEDGFRYLLKINGTRQRVRAKRVVMAVPLASLGRMEGDLIRELRSTVYHQNILSRGSCRWSAFFPPRWWWREGGRECTEGFCAEEKAFKGEENFLEWRLVSRSPTNGLRLIEYLPTPERQQGNLLEFRWEGEECENLERIYKVGEIVSLKNEIMSRVREALGRTIPDPIQSHFNYERSSLTMVKPGAPFNTLLLERWAVQPMVNESLCLVSQSYNLLERGEMEGAARSAHNCLKGRVFSDLISLAKVNEMESCLQTRGEKCHLTSNEYHMRDLANYSYCSNSSHFPYPTLSNFY